jgi:charged multivesicular body protein 6
VLERETAVAKDLVKQGKKKQAMTVLKKKKFQEQLLARSEAQLQTVQEMIDSVEFAQLQKSVFDGLKAGNEVLTALNKEMSVEKVNQLMEETDEAMQTHREIEEALAGHLTAEDTSAVEGELEALEQSMMKEKAAAMPAVPTAEPTAKGKGKEPAEEEQEEEPAEEEEKPKDVKKEKTKRVAVAV